MHVCAYVCMHTCVYVCVWYVCGVCTCVCIYDTHMCVCAVHIGDMYVNAVCAYTCIIWVCMRVRYV